MRPETTVNGYVPFVQRVVDDNRPLFGEPSTAERVLTDHEEYVQTVFYRMVNLMNALDQLHDAVFYLTRYPSSKAYRRSGPTRHRWYMYHMDQYYSLLMGVKDRLVALVGAIIDIDKSDERPKYPDVVRRIGGTEIERKLGSVAETVNDFEGLRHALVHETAYSDQELALLGAFEVLAESSSQMAREPQAKADKLEWWWVANTVPTLKDTIEELEERILALLSTLLPVYVDTSMSKCTGDQA